MPETCRLCEAIDDSAKAEGARSVENTPLIVSPNFVVMPALGPLVAGHVLVVSRLHAPSLASLGTTAIVEYEELAVKHLKHRQSTLEAEHGATERDCAGACIAHAHVHWIPGFANFEAVFDGVLRPIYRGAELRLPESRDVPYIFLRGSLGDVRILDAAELPSQMLRQAICGALGRSDWDWRQQPRFDLISQSINDWIHQ